MLTRNPQLYSDEQNARWCRIHGAGWCIFPMAISTDLMAFLLPFFEAQTLFIAALVVTAIWCAAVALTKWVSIPVIVFDEWLAARKSDRYLFVAGSAVLFFQGAYYKILFYLFFMVFAKYIFPRIVVAVSWLAMFFLMMSGFTLNNIKARFDVARRISERLMAKLGYQAAE